MDSRSLSLPYASPSSKPLSPHAWDQKQPNSGPNLQAQAPPSVSYNEGRRSLLSHKPTSVTPLNNTLQELPTAFGINANLWPNFCCVSHSTLLSWKFLGLPGSSQVGLLLAPQIQLPGHYRCYFHYWSASFCLCTSLSLHGANLETTPWKEKETRRA